MAIQLNANQSLALFSNMVTVLKLYATNTSVVPANFIASFFTDNLDNGDTKVFRYADLQPSKEYSETSTLLTVTKPTVKEDTLSISERRFIPMSYTQDMLKFAWLDEYGVSDFIGYTLGQMESAETSYLYDLVVNEVFTKEYTLDTMTVSVDLIDTEDITDAEELNNAEVSNNKKIAMAIQATLQNMGVYSTVYNEYEFQTALAMDNVKMIWNANYKNDQVVNLNASLLNSSVIGENFITPEQHVIPAIKIPTGEEETICYIMHKEAFQIFFAYVKQLAFFDSSNLYTNNFRHFAFGYGHLAGLPQVKIVANYV